MMLQGKLSKKAASPHQFVNTLFSGTALPWHEPANLVASIQRKPDAAPWPGSYAKGSTIGRWQRKLSDIPLHIHAPNLIARSIFIRPMRLSANSVNQRLPSGPAVIPSGSLVGVESGNSMTLSPDIICPMLPVALSVNQSVLLGPEVISSAGPGAVIWDL